MQIKIYLLGKFQIELGGQVVPAAIWKKRKARSLVQILALRPAHQMHREELAELLFPETLTPMANLSRILYIARRALEPVPSFEKYRSVLVNCEKNIQLGGTGAGVWTDVAEFKSLAADGLKSGDLSALEQAATSYGGDLLPDVPYEDWACDARRQLRSLFLKVLRTLVAEAESRRQFSKAVYWNDKLLEAEPTDEPAHCRRMRQLAEDGDLPGVRRQFEVCCAILKTDLRVAPAPETVRLFKEITLGLSLRRAKTDEIPTARSGIEIITARKASGSPDFDVYRLYLKGTHLLGKRNLPYIRRGLACFRQALALDIKFAPAYAGIAQAYNLLGIFGAVSAAGVIKFATAAAHKALALDENLIGAHIALAHVECSCSWELGRGGRQMEYLRRDAGANVIPRQWYSEWLSIMGASQEAVIEAESALRLEPLSISAGNALGHAYYYAGDYRRAIQVYAETLEIEEMSAKTHLYLGNALRENGNLDRAIEHFRSAANLSPGGQELATLAHALMLSGAEKEAETRLHKIFTPGHEYVSPYYIAAIKLSAGAKSEALDWLEKARLDRSPQMIYLEIDPFFRELRNAPRFGTLLKKVRGTD